MGLSYRMLRKAFADTQKKQKDWVSLAIPAAGLIVSAAIGLSTWAVNNAKQNSDEYSDFRDFADSEITFWSGLYDKYMGTFDGTGGSDDERRRIRLLAIADLIQVRGIPDFNEFQNVALDRKCAIIIRLENIQTSLRNNLDERGQKDQDPLLGEALLKRFRSSDATNDSRCDPFRFRVSNADNAAAANAAEEPPPIGNVQIAPPPNQAAPVGTGGTPSPGRTPVVAPKTAPLPAQAPLGAQTPVVDAATRAFSGQSDSGWDVDIFWCRGDQEQLYYQRALALGESFGNYAKSSRTIATGVKLGRIRVRAATTDYQQRPGSAAKWNIVIADYGPGEEEAGKALVASANAVLGQPLVRLGRSNGTQTKWYLSLFLCQPN